MKHLVRLAAVAAVLLGMAGQSAKADILATLTGVTAQGGGVFRWTYNFQYQVLAGSVTPTVNDSIVLPSFAYLTGTVGFTPGSVNLAVSASNLNSPNGQVSVSVSGFPGFPPAAINSPATVTVASFFVDSNSSASKGVTANWNQLNPASSGTSAATVAAIPEPSQLALAGVVGLFVLGGRVLRRRRKA